MLLYSHSIPARIRAQIVGTEWWAHKRPSGPDDGWMGHQARLALTAPTHLSHCTVTSPVGCPRTTRRMRCSTAWQLHFDHDESDYNKREEMKRNGDLRLLHPEAL
jgi:hypothetical protein